MLALLAVVAGVGSAPAAERVATYDTLLEATGFEPMKQTLITTVSVAAGRKDSKIYTVSNSDVESAKSATAKFSLTISSFGQPTDFSISGDDADKGKVVADLLASGCGTIIYLPSRRLAAGDTWSNSIDYGHFFRKAAPSLDVSSGKIVSVSSTLR